MTQRTPYTETMANSNANGFLGISSGGGREWLGRIAHVAAYSTSLDNATVWSHYLAGLGGAEIGTDSAAPPPCCGPGD